MFAVIPRSYLSDVGEHPEPHAGEIRWWLLAPSTHDDECTLCRNGVCIVRYQIGLFAVHAIHTHCVYGVA